MIWIVLAVHVLTVFMVMNGLRYVGRRRQALTLPHWAMLGSVALFLPLLGSALLWLFNHRHLIPARPEEKAEASPLAQAQEDFLEYFDSQGLETDLRTGQGDERLNSLNIENYLDLLMSSRELNAKPAVALLKQALGCKAENARLLAYALYSKKEQGLFQLLDDMLAQFKQGQMNNSRLNLAIAQLYWHMLDIDLVDPAIAPDMWEKLYVHASLVMKREPSLWQPYWLLAQADLKAQRYDSAHQRFIKALTVGADRAQVDPFLLEIQTRVRRDLSMA